MSQNTRNIFYCQSHRISLKFVISKNGKKTWAVEVTRQFPGVSEWDGIEPYHLHWHPLNLIRKEDDQVKEGWANSRKRGSSSSHSASGHHLSLSFDPCWKTWIFCCFSSLAQLQPLQKRTSGQTDLLFQDLLLSEFSGPVDCITLLMDFLRPRCSNMEAGPTMGI